MYTWNRWPNWGRTLLPKLHNHAWSNFLKKCAISLWTAPASSNEQTTQQIVIPSSQEMQKGVKKLWSQAGVGGKEGGVHNTGHEEASSDKYFPDTLIQSELNFTQKHVLL